MEVSRIIESINNLENHEIIKKLTDEPIIVERCLLLQYNFHQSVCTELHSNPSRQVIVSKICHVFGERELDAIEFMGDSGDLILVTMKNNRVRDFLVSKVSTISWAHKPGSTCTCGCVLAMRPLAPLATRIHFTVSGIPHILLKSRTEQLTIKVRKILPGLSNVEYRYQYWPESEIGNGTLLISGKSSNVIKSIEEVRDSPKFLVMGGFGGRVMYWREGHAVKSGTKDMLTYHGW
ncbi:hypothetical protein Pcinc_025980 [Petrolisthes cinctipes]|uniref:Uncharacterized protein n=1 Tax=Petrolisthes cinctipes TaxID=88211 RepID=A0AAE1K8P7_PETCI|nr:hypothetical protein Pcinc_025980 [Petrolisthes cinctipes]